MMIMQCVGNLLLHKCLKRYICWAANQSITFITSFASTDTSVIVLAIFSTCGGETFKKVNSTIFFLLKQICSYTEEAIKLI